jgi:SnoaL-like domain
LKGERCKARSQLLTLEVWYGTCDCLHFFNKDKFLQKQKANAVMNYVKPSAASEAVASSADRLSEPTIRRYFETFNAEDFQATASLFAAEGGLYPPFEGAVVGREAIAAYLQKEAKGMKALPHQETLLHPESDSPESDSPESSSLEPSSPEPGSFVWTEDKSEYKVTGKVLTALFSVNVSWKFVLNSESQILTVRVKLLAGLEELLRLKQ